MGAAIVTGSGGLVGSEAAAWFSEAGFDVVGLDIDMRRRLFGPAGSTAETTRALRERYPDLRVHDLDIRDASGVDRLIAQLGSDLELIVHTAAQPSHDWAASDPRTDFAVNAVGTVNLLEAARRRAPDATFVFCSTSKVYGDHPNRLPLVEDDQRLDLPEGARYREGIDTSMPIDQSLHSLMGASKAAADLMVQEYGRYFGMPTVCFRPGCITGPAHAGTVQHGFLSYLLKCTVRGARYEVLGYRGKQVRCNLHSRDLVRAFHEFHRRPTSGAAYNIGGGRGTDCSVLEGITICESIAGRQLDWSYIEQARRGDHRWWISDLSEFRADYPAWQPEYDLEAILREMHELNRERWVASPA